MIYKEKNEADWWISEIERRLKEKNTDLFRVVDHMVPLTKFLLQNSSGTIFLNRQDFKKLYPALKSPEFQNSNVNLIVSADVLFDEKRKKPHPFGDFSGDKYFKLTPQEEPLVSNLSPKNRIFVASPDVNCFSFMVFNNRTYLLKNNDQQDPYFSCALNAAFDKKQKDRLAILSKALQHIKPLSVLFKDIPQKTTSQQHNRLRDSGYERE